MNKLICLCGLPFFSLLLLTACNPFAGNADQRATERAHSTAGVQTALFAGTQAGTVVALQSTADSASLMATQLAQLQREREFLEATIQAIQTFGAPAQPRLTAAPARTPSPLLSTNFLSLRTSSGIDESTGCAIDEKTRYASTVQRIYFNFVAQNLRAGTILKPRWYKDDQLRYDSDEWIPDQDYAEICVYFWLEPAYTPFEAGTWRVELVVDGQVMGEIPFQICPEGTDC